jgi:protein-S-isoprenylcysteine O-methyltransferase Ste14
VTRRIVQIAVFLAVWAALLFASAGRLDYPRGWICLGAYVAVAAVTGVLAHRRNPGVIAARGRSGPGVKRFDRVVTAIYVVLLFATPVVAGLDAVRFGWSAMPPAMLWPGLALYVAGAVPVVWAMAANPFLERMVRIQQDRDHRVVRSGPYRFVRHPMYVGILLQAAALPLILGSWWTFAPAAATWVLFAFRTALEDRTLRNELDGYEDYTRQTRYRLLPGVW